MRAVGKSGNIISGTSAVGVHNATGSAHAAKFARRRLREFAMANRFSVPSATDVTCVASTSADAALTKVYSFANTLDPQFCFLVGGRPFRNFLSATYLQIVGSTHTSGANELGDCGGGIEFETDADVVEVKTNNYSSANVPRLAVVIDGVYQGVFTQDATATNIVTYMKFTHGGGREVRRWRITTSDTSFLWMELHVGATMTILRPAERLPKIFVLGDSVREGYNATQPYVANAYVHHLGRLLDANVVNCSRTGTGYLEEGGSAGYRSFTGRWSTEASSHADAAVYVFGSSCNDAQGVGTHTYAQADVVAAAVALWQSARAQSPLAHICVESPEGYLANANVTALHAALKAGFDSWADPDSSWFDSRTILTTANAATYWADSTVHPNDVGHSYYARHLARHLVSKL